MNKLSVVFFGNGPVAAKSLEKLLDWVVVELVITKTRPAHHKDPAPVEVLAKKKAIEVALVSNKHELDNLINDLRPSSKLGLVIDFGVIINQPTINYFRFGIINSHFSLLPQWRGADPITYSILSGQPTSGVSLMQIDSGLDTGPILASQTLKVEHQTNLMLTNELISLSDNLLKQTLPLVVNGTCHRVKQSSLKKIATYSRILKKTDGVIDCNKLASVVEREIRAFSGWPNSTLTTKDGSIIICSANVSKVSTPPGELRVVNKKLFLGCGHNTALEIISLKPPGKKEMDATSFINGYRKLLAV